MNDEQKLEIGKTVRELRSNTGKDRQVFADHCNIDVSQLLKIEEGRGEPGMLTLFRLASGFDMRPGKLLDIIYDRLRSKGLLDDFQLH